MWRQAAALQQLAGRGAPRGKGEGREGGARGEGGRSRGEVGAACTPPCGRVTGRTEGACSEGTRARARTLRAPGLSGCVRRAQRPAGWLAGWREGGREGRWEGTRSVGLRLLVFHLRSEFTYLGAVSENAHVWAGLGLYCWSGFCLLLKRPALTPELFSTPLRVALIECELRGPAHWTQKP